MKHLLAFFMLGTLLYGYQEFVSQYTRPRLDSTIEAPATGLVTEQIVNDCYPGETTDSWEKREESFLLCLASHFDWYYSDGIVQKRLKENMGRLSFDVQGSSKPVEAAIAMGADQLDPIVKRRRIQRVLLELRNIVKEMAPKGDTDTFKSVDLQRVHFSHLFFAEKRKLQAQSRKLIDHPPEDLDFLAVSDPFFHGVTFPSLTLGEIERRFGREFRKELSHAPHGQWSHPIESEFGWHLVWVHKQSRHHKSIPLESPLRETARHNEKSATLVRTFLQRTLTERGSSERMLR